MPTEQCFRFVNRFAGADAAVLEDAFSLALCKLGELNERSEAHLADMILQAFEATHIAWHAERDVQDLARVAISRFRRTAG